MHFNKLRNYLEKIEEINYLIKVLEWEINTTLPSSSFEYATNLKNVYEEKLYELKISKEYKDILKEVLASKDFTKLREPKKRYILTLERDYKILKKVPKVFYLDFKKLKDASSNAWLKAKKENDYNIFKPYLKKIIKYSTKYYKYVYPNSNVYDSMLSSYEEGLNTKVLDNLFDDLKKEILPLIKKQQKKNIKKVKFTLNDNTLLDVSKYLLDYINLDTSKCALGIFAHGYTAKFNNKEVRIAFPKTDNIIDHFLTVIHEGGHALYELNIANELKNFPFYEINKNAIHESISRFYENTLARNKNFWLPIYNDIKKITKINLSLNELIKHLNYSRPSMIRTRADELTYPIHIIIRYEIEKEIFNGKININDLPNIWNKKYKEYLGIEPQNDSEGILQDIHWSDASFGYFPSYLAGTIFDAMLLAKLEEELGSIDELLKKNNVKEITAYLTNSIFKYGSTYNINELSNRICKKNLEVESLINYYKKKYE